MKQDKDLIMGDKKRFNKLKSDRVNWEQHWEEVSELVIPRKNDVYGTRTPGDKRRERVYDSTGEHVNELLASALQSNLTNPAGLFFELSTGDLLLDNDDSARKYLQYVTRSMHNVLNNSNFQTEVHQVYLDLGSFGTGFLRIEEDDEMIVRFHSRPVYEMYVAENNKGFIDTVFRSFKWKAKQVVDEFGEENVSDKVKESHKNNDQKDFEILHAVYPVDKKAKNPKGYTFYSRYYLMGEDHMLSDSGFKEYPFATPRWTKVSGEVYGRSPAMKALPDIKMLNEMAKVTIRSAQKVVDPPWLLPDDGVMLPFRTQPNGINYFRAGTQDRPEPMVTGARVDFGVQLMDRIRLSIERAFFIDQLQLPPETPQMTATEVQQRTEEKMRLLGPILARQEFEFLRPIVDRVFAIMVRKDMIPPAPEVLQNTQLQVRYSSMIAKAQRTSEAANLTRALNLVAPIMQALPEMFDNIDGDEAIRHAFKTFSVPEEILKTVDARDEQRQARQEQAAQAQAMQEAQVGSEVASKLGVTG